MDFGGLFGTAVGVGIDLRFMSRTEYRSRAICTAVGFWIRDNK